MSAAEDIQDAIDNLLSAQHRLAQTQKDYTNNPGMPGDRREVDIHKLWHALETIDDRIHDALSKLGN